MTIQTTLKNLNNPVILLKDVKIRLKRFPMYKHFIPCGVFMIE